MELKTPWKHTESIAQAENARDQQPGRNGKIKFSAMNDRSFAHWMLDANILAELENP